jgi:hypothetical protein
MATEQDHSGLQERDAAFAEAKGDRDITLAALHRLEAAAGMAGHGREVEWLDQVLADLRLLDGALRREHDESMRPDSLFSMIARDYPRRFGSRVRDLHAQHEEIDRALAGLRAHLESMPKDMIQVADLRQRLGEVISAIRRRRERETDLVFEAIRLDLGSAEHDRSRGVD